MTNERAQTELPSLKGLYPPSRRTHGVYCDEDAAFTGAHDLARLLNGVPSGWVLYTAPKMGAWAVCSCRTEEMNAWRNRVPV